MGRSIVSKSKPTSHGTVDTLLDFDFSRNIPSDKIWDTSNNCHGTLFNAPTPAVTGHSWDNSSSDWRHASYGNGASHFQDDDLDDAAWETSSKLQLPPHLKSGCCSVHISDDESKDIVPFFVRPDPKASTILPVALIIPTVTYNGQQCFFVPINLGCFNISKSLCEQATKRLFERGAFRVW